MGAEEQREQKFNRMTQTPIPKLICQLAVPTIISMLVTSFYNMADTFFVGKIEHQRHRRGGRRLPADGYYPGLRLFLRPRLGQLYLPAAGRAEL